MVKRDPLNVSQMCIEFGGQYQDHLFVPKPCGHIPWGFDVEGPQVSFYHPALEE